MALVVNLHGLCKCVWCLWIRRVGRDEDLMGSESCGRRFARVVWRCVARWNTQTGDELQVIEVKDVELVQSEIVKDKSVSIVCWRGERLVRKSFAKKEKHESYENESAAAKAGLSHRHIIEYVGYNDKDKVLYTVRQYSNLSQHMLDRCRDQPDIYRLSQESIVIVLQIAKGMVYLHDTKCIVHGDLKPENILLSFSKLRYLAAEYPLVKVADLGSAQSVEGYKCQGVGPPLFEAPEVRRWRENRTRPKDESGEDLEKFENPRKIDVFGFGTVLYQMLVHPLLDEKEKEEEGKRKDLTPEDYDRLETKFMSCQKARSLLILVKSYRDPKPENRPCFVKICEQLHLLANVEEPDYKPSREITTEDASKFLNAIECHANSWMPSNS